MHTARPGKPEKRDRSSENFRKRWRTFDKSGFDVHRAYRADVYVLVRRKGQVFEFRSGGESWLLTPEEVVRHNH